jgi:hypothetical protein
VAIEGVRAGDRVMVQNRPCAISRSFVVEEGADFTRGVRLSAGRDSLEAALALVEDVRRYVPNLRLARLSGLPATRGLNA